MQIFILKNHHLALKKLSIVSFNHAGIDILSNLIN